MPLKKGFIRPFFPFTAIPKYKFWLGIVIGALQIIVIYFLATYIRETLRWGLSITIGDPWLFSEEERQFYNFFFALISLVWAQSTCVFIWFTGTNHSITKHRFRNHRRDILNDHQVILWAVLLFLLNNARLYATYFGYDNHHYVFSFYPDYQLLFIGFVVVIFLHQWLTIRRQFRFPLKYILGLGIGYVAIATLLSMVNMADHQKMDTTHRDYKRITTYQLDLPQVDSYQHLRKQNKDLDIFLLYPKSDSLKQNQPHIWIEDKQTSFEDLGMELELQKLKVHPAMASRITHRLFIDKETPYSVVKQLKQRLRVQDCLKVAYMTAEKGYRKNNMGLLLLLNPLCEEEWEKGSEKVVLKDSTRLLLIPPPPCLPQPNKDEEIIILLEINAQNQLFIGEQEANLAAIFSMLHSLISIHKEKLVLILRVNERAKYDYYVQLMDIMLGAYKQVRNEDAMTQFGETYDDLSPEQMREVRLKYPLHILEK
ncbi:MAG: hypothetical protein R3E32_21230 [Chitinophagales bacterium]